MIEITDLQRITLKSDDVIVARIDMSVVPPPRRKEFASNVKNTIKAVFPKNECLVLDKDVEMFVIGKDELQ